MIKLTKSNQRKLNKFRIQFKKLKKRLGLKYPKWSVILDPRTFRIQLAYSIPYEILIDGKLKVFKKKQFLYLKNRTIDDFDFFLTEIKKYHEQIIELVNKGYKAIETDDESIGYWVKRYLNRINTDLTSISNTTIAGDKYILTDFILYLDDIKPTKKSIYDIDKNLIKDYLLYRKNVGGRKKKWSNTTIHTGHRRIRGFYNWLSKIDDLQLEYGILNKMDLPKPEPNDSIFSIQEIRKIITFMNELKNDKEWEWFIPILRTFLLTGARLSEITYMKCDDINLETKEWYFKGKGDKKRKMIFQDEELFEDIKSRFYDKNGNLIPNKPYVFHRQYFRKGNKGLRGFRKGAGEGYVIDYTKSYHSSGIYHKFKKMLELLGLRNDLTPHSCRRFYITQMLKETGGDIPLVAQLVGHSSWDMVKRYSKIVIDENTQTNLNLNKLVN